MWPRVLGPYIFFMHTQEKLQERGFHTLTIASGLLDRIKGLGYTIPTPIQHRSIPLLLEGRDLIGIAQTGTGKTLAFALPVIQRIARMKCRALVLVPTRELALQVDETFVKLGKGIGLKTAVLIGGADIRRQMRSLKTHPHVIIGTPGRIIDHLTQKSLHFSNVKMLVLDEADRMLDMGFAPQIKRILESVPSERQTMLFSATMPSAIHKLASTYLSLPERVEVARSGTPAEHIEQEIRFVPIGKKFEELERTLRGYRGTALVFVRTKHAAKKLTQALYQSRFRVAEIHSNRSLAQRRAALDGFKLGKHQILVATDIAARGIDVTGIGMVINFDLPENAEDYVHRIGRTGRAGSTGKAISFAAPQQGHLVRDIEKLTGTSIETHGQELCEPDKPARSREWHSRRPSRGPSRFQRRRSSMR